MRHRRKLTQLELGKDYIIWWGPNDMKYASNISICKFIQPTRCGFNFLDMNTSKCILPRHLYPTKQSKGKSIKKFFINSLMHTKLIHKEHGHKCVHTSIRDTTNT